MHPGPNRHLCHGVASSIHELDSLNQKVQHDILYGLSHLHTATTNHDVLHIPFVLMKSRLILTKLKSKLFLCFNRSAWVLQTLKKKVCSGCNARLICRKKSSFILKKENSGTVFELCLNSYSKPFCNDVITSPPP